MARIRTIKPEFFLHEGLADADAETGLPLRLAYIGLWCCADREGRFEWRARRLKAQILPYDDIDFSRVLDALTTRGFIEKYECDGGTYGSIPSFSEHQVINNREKDSALPEPNENNILTRERRVNDACATPLKHALEEGKGREGNKEGKGREGNKKHLTTGANAPSRSKGKPEPITNETWAAYATSYLQRYGTEPVRNASVNSKLAQFVNRVGKDDAPHIAAYFVGLNTKWYVTKGHAVGVMLSDAEKLATEWRTNRTVTDTEARQGDQRQAQAGVWQRLLENERAKHGEQ